MTTLEDDVKALGVRDDFCRVLQQIRDNRERHITELKDADKDSVMRLAGVITAYDDILSMTDGLEAIARFESRQR